MTVSYQNEVASSTSGGFTRLLLKWRGSLYKLIYRELALFCVAYIAVSLVYFHLLTADQKRTFEQIRDYCDQFISLIPLSFVLGFYVTFVAQRWWQQYTAIPWPDKILHAIALYVRGADENSRMIRRTMVRYLNLSLILLLRSISSAVKRRLPTLEHLVESGFMTAQELEEFTSVPRKEFNTYWIPCCWFVSLLREARTTNHVVDPMGLKLIIETFNEYRANCGTLWSYDWVSIPLVYTQVVTIATYTFFVACLVGRQQEVIQLTDKQGVQLDLYIPLFTILQFLFYMGLLKVAEQLINPFGDDDEDFELNWIIDRHVKVSYLIVDTLNVRRPPLVKDMYFDDPGLTLPYTEASVQYKIPTYRGSVDNMKVPVKEHTMVLPEIKEEQDENSEEAEHFFGSTSLGSIAAENGLVDGRDPRVGAMSVPDEALLAGLNRTSPANCRGRPQNHSESAGSCGSVARKLVEHSSAEATPQADRPATWRPKLDTQFSIASSCVSDEAALRRAAEEAGTSVTRHTSLSFPNRLDRQPPKRSTSTQSGHILPARWRKRKKAEVIWHPYVPPATSDQSLTDNGQRPEVTCLVSELDERHRVSPQNERHRRSVPSVFVQAPSFRRESPRGARSRKTWADLAPFSRSWDERRGCWTEPSPNPTEPDPSPIPSDRSPALTDPGPDPVDPSPGPDSMDPVAGISDPGPSIVSPGPIMQLLDPMPADPDPSDADGEVFASANQLEDISAEASDEDQYPLQPLPAVSSLPDIQRAAKPNSRASILERKLSLPASANKRVQILEPGEVEDLLGRAAPRGATAAIAIPREPATRSPLSRSPRTLDMPGTSGTSGTSGLHRSPAMQGMPGPSGMAGISGAPGPPRSPEVSESSGMPGTSGIPATPGTPGTPGTGEPSGPTGPPSVSVSPSQRRIEAQREARRKRL